MIHRLPELPYPIDGLAPRISAETLQYHWGKHHQAYVDNLNRLVAGTAYAEQPVEEVVRRTEGALFNHAAQHFNHSFYWNSLSPSGGDEPAGPLAEAIRRRFGSFAAFRTAFTEKAATHFGSGWCWLVAKRGGDVAIEPAHDADCPLVHGDLPLLACDVWEHAYYIDYRNQRAKYLEAFWGLANWRFAEERFQAGSAAASP